MSEALEMSEALRRVKREEIESDELIEVARRVGPAALQPLLDALFIGGEPHEGARANPAWTAFQSELIAAIGATRAPEALPWLAFVIHFASDLDAEGPAADALSALGTPDALEVLVEAALESSAIGDDAEDLYYAIRRQPEAALVVLSEAVDEAIEGNISAERVHYLLTLGVESDDPAWSAARPLLRRLEDFV